MRNVRFDIVNQNVLIGEGGMETAFASSPAIQIVDSDDEEIVVEAVGTVPIDEKTAVGNFASSEDIESGTIFTKNSSGTYNSNDG